MEPESGFTAEEIDSAMGEIYGDLIDGNAAVVQQSRHIGEVLEDIEVIYAQQMGRIQELRALIIEGARIIADQTSNLLAAEYGFIELQDVEDDEEEV